MDGVFIAIIAETVNVQI